MKTQLTQRQNVLVIVTALALILTGIFFYTNRSLKDQLNKEKIKSEALLSEKLNLDKSTDKFKKDLASLQNKILQLNKSVKGTSDQLVNKNAEIKKLIAENASLQDLKKKNAELEALRSTLENEIIGLNLNMEQILAENKRMVEQLATIVRENESLTLHNALLEAMLADNYRIEALKGKRDKLTVAARRTNKLMISFDIPAEISEELYFNIITPDGKELSSRYDRSVTMKFHNQDKNLMASLTGTPSGSQDAKRAELIYKPEQKLSKGIYRFNVYNNEGEYMGSIQLRLK